MRDIRLAIRELRSDMRQMRQQMGRMGERMGGMDERMGRMEFGIAKIQGRVEHLPTVWTLVVTLPTFVFGALSTVVAVVAALAP